MCSSECINIELHTVNDGVVHYMEQSVLESSLNLLFELVLNSTFNVHAYKHHCLTSETIISKYCISVLIKCDTNIQGIGK